MAELVAVANRILDFYAGTRADPKGRRQAEIVAWPDTRIEAERGFVPWLFPLPGPSPVNPEAPVLDAAMIARFRARPDLGANLRMSLTRMLAFYGFDLEDGAGWPRVERAANFAAQAEKWLVPVSQHHIHITRILQSCSLLGLEPEARAFLAALEAVHADHPGAITLQWLRLWQKVVE